MHVYRLSTRCLQCFISLLSEESIKSKYCRDELALAYVSQKHIFPCGLATAEELFPAMDTGMYVTIRNCTQKFFLT